MQDIYRRHSTDDPTTIHVVDHTPSIQVMGNFMEAHAYKIKDAGHIAKST